MRDWITPSSHPTPNSPPTRPGAKAVIRYLGSAPYEPTWRAMQKFTDERQDETADEIWFVEHPPVFTLGLNASREHLLAPGEIPVVQIDSGGQVTYPGPGQLMIYPLLNLRRLKLGVRDLVMALENAVIDYVAQLGLTASGSRQAPGVYIDGAKLASVGLRIRRGACYHGMALNVALDLEPFEGINVCGYKGLRVTPLADLGVSAGVDSVAQDLLPHLLRRLGYAPAAARYSAINTDLQAVNSR